MAISCKPGNFSKLPRALSLANPPARPGNRSIRGPIDGSRISAARRTAGARVAAATHRQNVVPGLGRECLYREGNVTCHGHCTILVVAVVGWVIRAADAVAIHRT